MNTYMITFKGRGSGAIGKVYDISVVRSGKDVEEAKLKIYDNYEHVQVKRVNKLNN